LESLGDKKCVKKEFFKRIWGIYFVGGGGVIGGK
jgi:hypothetical protein